MLVEKSNKTFLTSVYRKPTLTDSMHTWIYFDKRRRKLILLALLFTELLKFALRKSSQVKSTKSKIFCDRMVIQKKSLFLKIKRFQILKHPSDSTQKNVRCIQNYLELETFHLNTENKQVNSQQLFRISVCKIYFLLKKCYFFFKKMFYMLISKVILYTNIRATVIVCT